MEAVKFKSFLQIAKLLNEEFRIIPLLYGSLGLEQITSSDLKSGNVNMLIPEQFLSGDEWLKFIEFLEANDYTLIDADTHTFIKDDIEYSCEAIENLKMLADIDAKDIGIYEKSGVKYKSLSLDQHLLVYQRAIEDERRISVADKKEQDEEKISFIRSKM